jgi:DNA-binding MarR family transcriptional regulator
MAYDRSMAVPSVPASAATDLEQAMFEFVDAYNQAWEAAASDHELSTAHACVLGRVETRRSMGELAEELRCDASNITQIVARLEARELVHREPNPEDRRSRQIVRTPSGDDLYGAFEESFEFPRVAAAQLTVAERKQLTALLQKALRG